MKNLKALIVLILMASAAYAQPIISAATNPIFKKNLIIQDSLTVGDLANDPSMNRIVVWDSLTNKFDYRQVTTLPTGGGTDTANFAADLYGLDSIKVLYGSATGNVEQDDDFYFKPYLNRLYVPKLNLSAVTIDNTQGRILVVDSVNGNVDYRDVSTITSATDLSFTGVSSPITLKSSTGTDVTITEGTGIDLEATSTDLTISQEPKYFDLIATGQSNMVNRDLTQGSWVFDTLPQVQVYDIAAGKFKTANPYANNISPENEPGANIRNNIAFAFAKNYIADHPYDTVRMVVSAKGGLNSDKWLSGAQMRDSIINKLTRVAVIAPDFQAQAILVHQGENDDVDNTESSWLNNWINFYDYITARSDVSDTCIMLFGTFANTTTTYNAMQRVVDSLTQQLRYIGGRRMYAVQWNANNSAALYPDGQNVHFTNEYIDYIGTAYYSAYKYQPQRKSFNDWSRTYNITGQTHNLGKIRLLETGTTSSDGITWGDIGLWRTAAESMRFASLLNTNRALQLINSNVGATLYGIGNTSNALVLAATSTATGITGDLMQLTLSGVNGKGTFTKQANNANSALTVNASNAAQTGHLLDLQENAITLFNVTHQGKITFDVTNTAAGTTGNRTIDKPSGTVNFAAGATTLTVTNNTVTINSIVTCVVMTNDATAIIKNVVPAAGSFVITLNAAATAETRVGFVVFN